MTEYGFGETVRQEDLRRLWKLAFGDEDGFLDLFFSSGYDPEAMQAALSGEALAGMLYWFDCELDGKTYAYIYAVATDPAFEGRGVATGLLKRTHEVLRSRGYAGAILVPGSQSLVEFYSKRGYEPVSRISERTAFAEGSAEAEEISWTRYMELRPQFAPKHTMLQTGRNVAFLEHLGRCCRGEGFLAAVSREDPSVCMEFLGNPLSGLAGHLGCRQIRARVPGDDRPFAMGIRFDGGVWPENLYFSFAFD